MLNKRNASGEFMGLTDFVCRGEKFIVNSVYESDG